MKYKVYLLSHVIIAASFVPLSALMSQAEGAPTHHKIPREIGSRSTKKSTNLTAKSDEQIAVVAHRLSHGTHVGVTASELQRAVPGTNPMKILGQQPGVLFQSDDPQGLDNYSTQIYMHGFQSQEIGMTLDGMPLGEMTYRNYNGLNPFQAISSENVERVDVSQSAGAESIAATNNLGGSIEYISRNPSHRRGGTLSQTFGSNSTYHTFVRFDSGDLNPIGTRFYTSYMRNDTMMWKNYGEQFLQQVNAKLVQPIGHASEISAFFNWDQNSGYSYQDQSFDMINKLGYGVGNYYNGHKSGYIAAYNAALGHYPASFSKLSDPADAAYYDAGQKFSDLFGGLSAHLRLTDALTWNSTFYGHGSSTSTTWSSPYFGSPNGSAMSELVKQPEIQRFGLRSSLEYHLAHHQIGLGVWYENNRYKSPMNAYSQPVVKNGEILGTPFNSVGNYGIPFAHIYNQTYNTNTFTAFVQDTYRPFKGMFVHFGFKSVLNTTRVGNGYLNSDYYGVGTQIASGVGMTVAKPFLPHISLEYRITHSDNVFVDISQSVHVYPQSGYHLSASPYAVSQSAFNALRQNLKPETAWTYGAGYRHDGSLISASLYLYRTNFFNRLQQITSGSVVNPVSTVANVGGVTMNGFDAGITLTPFPGLALSNSVSYDHATYDQNVQSGGQVYGIQGEQVVNYPRWMYKTRLSYTWKNFSTYVDASWIGKRHFSYVGDVSAPSYWLANFGTDYKFHHLFGAKDRILTVSFNVYNLNGARYITTMGEDGNPMSIATGALSYQSFQLAAPRQFFGTLRLDF